MNIIEKKKTSHKAYQEQMHYFSDRNKSLNQIDN
jgi:hypothetical protein